MQLVKRSQNRLPLILGMFLFLTPFIFGLVTLGTTFPAWAFGAVVSVAAVALGLLWLGFPRNGITAGLTVLMGLVLLIAPWFLSISLLSAGVLASSLLGMFLIIAAGGMLERDWYRQVAFSMQRSARESASLREYRRVSNPL